MIQPPLAALSGSRRKSATLSLMHRDALGSAHSAKDTLANYDSRQPFAAIVAYVWNARCVNLSVIGRRRHALRPAERYATTRR